MPRKRTMPIGQKFGRLTVIGDAAPSGARRKARWLCRCECGDDTIVVADNVMSGHTRSCGCLHREMHADRLRTHGMSQTSPEYTSWRAMRNRCSGAVSGDPGGYYSARGIDMAPEWESFERFYADMGARPSPSHSIDRIDNARGYWPDNCRWATDAEQSRNRRHVQQISHDGLTMSLAEWAVHLGISYATLQGRRNRRWSIERMLTTPTRPIRHTHRTAHRDHIP